MVNNQMNDLMKLLKQMDSTVKSIREMTENECNGVGLNIEVVDDLVRFTKEQIEAFTPNIIMNIYEKFKVSPSTFDYPQGYDEKVEKIKENILNLYDSAISYKEICIQRDDLAKEVQTALDDYASYLSSDEMKEKEAQQIQDLKDRIEASEDESEKRTFLNRLKILDDSETLNFFFDRINSYNEKELESIMDSFFNKKRGSYIMDRYITKMRQMKYNPELFKSLLDIEANFLGKDFYPYNNLFLFAFMRYIAYTDVNSEKEFLYTQTLITRVTKLVFHKLSEDEEKYMLNLIENFDSKFEDAKESFVEHNVTSPLSSYRIEMEKKKKEETLTNIENWFFANDIILPSWYSYEEKVDYMKAMQKKVALKRWLDMYEIEYPKEASSDELEKIKASYDVFGKKQEELKKEESADTAEPDEDPVAEESSVETEKTT